MEHLDLLENFSITSNTWRSPLEVFYIFYFNQLEWKLSFHLQKSFISSTHFKCSKQLHVLTELARNTRQPCKTPDAHDRPNVAVQPPSLTYPKLHLAHWYCTVLIPSDKPIRRCWTLLKQSHNYVLLLLKNVYNFPFYILTN